ncbi:MAG: acetyl-CoA carboxylase carboxyltransferase subunit beta [Oligoflexia bacterium]|nr:acetyl-CoA carboxylase carboxyltransferase subunit beta [Oligoflexia bacterium]
MKAGPRNSKSDGPQLWSKCPSCKALLYNEELLEKVRVCARCGHHLRLNAAQRIASLTDADSFVRLDAQLRPLDPLAFVDSKPYSQRLLLSQQKTGELDAYLAGAATLDGRPIQIGAFDFAFMGGSMGSVVGELITRQIERGVAQRQPVVIVSASGGARMQEGVLSLMQMAKTSAALARLRDEARQPFISILTHPTTGGVAASFSMLGDVILAEPQALIGFAGPRVIEQTIGETLPDGFQTSEYLLDHGMVDRIVPRAELRQAVVCCLSLLCKAG